MKAFRQVRTCGVFCAGQSCRCDSISFYCPARHLIFLWYSKWKDKQLCLLFSRHTAVFSCWKCVTSSLLLWPMNWRIKGGRWLRVCRLTGCVLEATANNLSFQKRRRQRQQCDNGTDPFVCSWHPESHWNVWDSFPFCPLGVQKVLAQQPETDLLGSYPKSCLNSDFWPWRESEHSVYTSPDSEK